MPGYKTHDKAAYIAAPIITGASLAILPIEHSLLLGVAFLLSNHYLSPDLDVDSILNRRWGFLRFIWHPYRKIIYHRSVLSHSGPFSAAIRLLYLALWVFLPLSFIMPISAIYILLLHYWVLCAILYIGSALSDTLHTLLDLIF